MRHWWPCTSLMCSSSSPLLTDANVQFVHLKLVSIALGIWTIPFSCFAVGTEFVLELSVDTVNEGTIVIGEKKTLLCTWVGVLGLACLDTPEEIIAMDGFFEKQLEQ